MAKHIRADSRIQNLNYSTSWQHLSEKERNYAYYMSKASWEGALITLHQMCYEAPALFCIFQAYFADKNFDELQNRAQMNGVTEEEWANFIAYAGGFYGNMSNYHSFGAMKFIPDLPEAVFWNILSTHPKANQEGSDMLYALQTFRSKVEKEVYAYDAPYTQLNFPQEGGVTAYFSRSMTKEDLELTKEFLQSAEAVAKGLDILNTRVFKKSDSEFLLTVGSISEENNCNM